MIRQQGAAAGVSAYDLLNRPSTAYFHLETTGVSMDWVNDITLNADRYVGLSDTASRMIFKRGGQALELWSGTDLRLFSDAGTSSVAHWDGATGVLKLDDGSGNSPSLQFVGGSNDDTGLVFLADDAVAGNSNLVIRLPGPDSDSRLVLQDSTPAVVAWLDGDGQARFWGDVTLDDGSGDSPSLKLVGGTNDDTISIYLDDDGTTGGSDVNFVLSDTGGASNLEIWSSAPASVLALDSLGNIQLRNANRYVGRENAVRLEFASSDTATLYGDLAFNNSTGGVLWIRKSGDVQSDVSDIYADTQLGLAADTNVHVFIDADNDASNNRFVISKDAENVDNATELFRVEEAGDVGIGTNNPGALTEWGFSTANMQFIDAGTAGATNRAWLYVDIGGTTGWIRTFGGP
jgi:hypothetical protein